MILTVALVVSVTVIPLPRTPLHGFGMRGDLAYLAKPADGGGLQVERLRRSGTTWTPEYTFPQRFRGPLAVVALSDGVAIGDYEGGTVMRYRDDGSVVWKTWLRYPNRITRGPGDTVWAFFNSGVIVRKIADSSEFEPFLGKYGQELAMPELSDVAPRPDGGFYALDVNGTLLSVAKGGAVTILAEGLSAHGVIEARGSLYVLNVEGVATLMKVAGGKAQTVWTAPASDEQATNLFALPDGRVGVVTASERAGRVYLITPGR